MPARNSTAVKPNTVLFGISTKPNPKFNSKPKSKQTFEESATDYRRGRPECVMSTIHVAGGVGVAPTEMSAYDAALADANLHNYNLITVSSVIPADANLQIVDHAPDLGPAGNKLTVVQGSVVASPDSDSETIATGIGWATGPGPGLFYEASGTDPEAVEADIRRGLDAGCELREWTITDRDIQLSTAEPVDGSYTAVVMLAAYGDSDPIF